MSWYEALLWLSALIGAVGVIVKAVKKALKPISDAQAQISDTRAKIDGIAVNVEKLREHDKEQYLSILRLTMMSSEMPISERLIAGKKYIDGGGNGDCKAYYENDLVKKHTI